VARDPIEFRLFPLLSATDPDCATNLLLDNAIRDLRLEHDVDDIAIALLNIYAHADTRILCERVLEALAVLYDTGGNEIELFPSEEVQILYGKTLFEVITHSKSPDVRVNAIINMRSEDYDRLGVPLLNTLTLALRDSSSAVRYRAAMQLVELDREAALEILIAALQDPLCHITQNSAEGRSSAVWEILMALDEFGSDRAQSRLIIEEVVRFMHEVGPDVDLGYLDIWKAADTLAAHLGHPQVVFRHFSELIKHSDWRVREAVAHGLGHLAVSSEQAMALLLKLARDTEPEVAAEARQTYRGLHRRPII